MSRRSRRCSSVPVYNHYYPDGNNQINTPASAGRLVTGGPTIPVAVFLVKEHVDQLTRENKPLPAAVTGLALIDTGATLCMIDESALQSLGIPPSGIENVIGATGRGNQPTYPASLTFPGTPIPPIAFTNFIGSPLKAAGIVALLGRNVLRHFVMVYNGPGGFVSLSF